MEKLLHAAHVLAIQALEQWEVELECSFTDDREAQRQINRKKQSISNAIKLLEKEVHGSKEN